MPPAPRLLVAPRELQARFTQSLREFWKWLYSRNADRWCAHTEGAALPSRATSAACTGASGSHSWSRWRSRQRIARSVDSFRLVLAGDGAERRLVGRVHDGHHPLLELLPPQFDTDESRLMLTSRLVLTPCLVGLAAVDSRRSAPPTVAVYSPHPSPEFGYLNPGYAAILPRGTSPQAYAAEGMHALSDHQALEGLRPRCRVDRAPLDVEEMARRFAGGVLVTLGSG